MSSSSSSIGACPGNAGLVPNQPGCGLNWTLAIPCYNYNCQHESLEVAQSRAKLQNQRTGLSAFEISSRPESLLNATTIDRFRSSKHELHYRMKAQFFKCVNIECIAFCSANIVKYHLFWMYPTLQWSDLVLQLAEASSWKKLRPW